MVLRRPWWRSQGIRLSEIGRQSNIIPWPIVSRNYETRFCRLVKKSGKRGRGRKVLIILINASDKYLEKNKPLMLGDDGNQYKKQKEGRGRWEGGRRMKKWTQKLYPRSLFPLPRRYKNGNAFIPIKPKCQVFAPFFSSSLFPAPLLAFPILILNGKYQEFYLLYEVIVHLAILSWRWGMPNSLWQRHRLANLSMRRMSEFLSQQWRS